MRHTKKIKKVPKKVSTVSSTFPKGVKVKYVNK